MSPRLRSLPTSLLTLSTLWLVAACPGSSAVRTESQRAVRPGWIPSPNRAHPSLLYVTGTCVDQASLAAARSCAISDAEGQIERQLGRQVEVKGTYVEDEHSEVRRSGGGEVRDVWVLVAYPREELAREEARIADRVALGLQCSAEEQTCDPRFAERIEEAMTHAGMAPAPERLAPAAVAGRPTAALERAARLRAARLLLARLDGRFLSSMEGEYYAEARCDLRLLDAISGKVQRTFESGPVKGGHIDRASAVRKALDNCLAQLTAALAQQD